MMVPVRTVVCLPTYQEVKNLDPLVREVLDVAPVDVLVADDRSSDGTAEAADRLALESKRVFVLHRQGPRSVARAYVDAFTWALDRGYEEIVQMDADFSHQPRYLPALLESLRTADVAIGSRYVAGGGVDSWSLPRRITSQLGNVYARAVMALPYQDITSGFVAFRRQVLEAIDVTDLSGEQRGFQLALKFRAHRAGFKIVEVPIHFWDRVVGASKLTAGDVLRTAASALKLRAVSD